MMEPKTGTRTPEWLTSDFLNHCLHSNKKYEKYLVTSFETEPAVPPGNNFGSELLRVKVFYNKKSTEKEGFLSLIIKSPLTEGHYFDDFYSSEPKFYNHFLPEAYKLLSTGKPFAPNSFSTPIASVVALEDLKTEGYVMADRSKQLDFEHCHLYVTTAATFHAVSYAIQKQHPDFLLSMSKEKMFSNDIKSVQSTKNMIRYALEFLVKSFPEMELDEESSEILKKCSITLWDMLVEAHEPNKIFNCLNQGDPWTANMMFKYNEEGKPKEIQMLDFQNLRYASPACDLTFFIWSSANHEVRENRLDELLKIYLNTLNSRLAELKCSETLSYDTFKEHMLALSPMAVWTVATNLPFMLNPAPTDLSTLLSKLNCAFSPSDNPFKSYYFEGYREIHLFRLIKQLKMTGVFDFLRNKLDIVKT